MQRCKNSIAICLPQMHIDVQYKAGFLKAVVAGLFRYIGGAGLALPNSIACFPLFTRKIRYAAIVVAALKPEVLKSSLRSCGYRPNLLRSDFAINANLSIPLVGFAQFPTDSRSVCVAVFSETSEPRKSVEACRSLGAPLIFVCCDDSLQW